jgi:long-chain acyl-CoA synthetase
MADYPKGKPLPDLRVAISTTTALDPEVAARFRQRYGVGLSQALGIIEIGLPCINLRFAGQKNGSVGEVLPAYRIRLDDVGFGPGLREVFFSGKGLLDAYYRPFRTRDQILSDGWFATHDVGELDEDGCLYLRGRAKEVISVMGMKFFPQEVAEVLKRHSLVKDAAAFGVRHDRTGEAVRARVVLHSADGAGVLEQELKTHCAQHLAAYKVPDRIEIVASLPRTASGKVLHRSIG